MGFRNYHIRMATGLVASLALLLAIIHGCTTGGSGVETGNGTVAVIADPTADGPVAVSPDSVASRAVLANLSMLLPSAGVTDLALSIAPSDVIVNVGEPGTTTDPVSVLIVTMKFAAADAPDPCAEGVGQPVTFLVTIDAAGNVSNIDPPRVSLDAGTIALLLAGEVSLCTSIEANFAGSVQISGVTATIPPSGNTNGNSSGTGNVNANVSGSGGQGNANSNDNASFNQNDNASLNGNDNDDDDEDDDHGNDNTGSGGGSLNANQNSNSSNANANHNDNAAANDNGDDDDDDNDNDDDDD